MADNIQLPSSSVNVATDDIAGVHYPRTKITLGDNGVNGGDVSSGNPLPVTVSNPVTSMTVTNFPLIQTVGGEVTITNLPVTQAVSGTVNIGTLPSVTIANPVTSVAINNFPTTQAVSGTVSVSEVIRTKRSDVVSDSLVYRGEATIGSLDSQSVWRIVRLTIDVNGGVVEQYANGTAAFSHAWADRTTYTYS